MSERGDSNLSTKPEWQNEYNLPDKVKQLISSEFKQMLYFL